MYALKHDVEENTKNVADVLTRATLNTAEHLDLTQSSLARILGVSDATISRLGERRRIETTRKEGELAILLIRLFRSLDTLVGGQRDSARKWFHAPNRHLGGTPAQLVETVSGLVRVVEYLDALRGRA